MTDQHDPEPNRYRPRGIPHRWVAQQLGYTESGIQRFRTGSRPPTIQLMRAIEKTWHWSISAQETAHENGTWIAEFEATINTHHNAQQKTNRKD